MLESFLAGFPRGRFEGCYRTVGPFFVGLTVYYEPTGQPRDYIKLYALLQKTAKVDMYLGIGRWIDHMSLQKALTDFIIRDLTSREPRGVHRDPDELRHSLWNKAYVYGVIGTDYIGHHVKELRGTTQVALLDFVLDELAGSLVHWKGIMQRESRLRPSPARHDAVLLTLARDLMRQVHRSGETTLSAPDKDMCTLLAMPVHSEEGLHVEPASCLLDALKSADISPARCAVLSRDWRWEALSVCSLIVRGLHKGDVLVLALDGRPPHHIPESLQAIRL